MLVAYIRTCLSQKISSSASLEKFRNFEPTATQPAATSRRKLKWLKPVKPQPTCLNPQTGPSKHIWDHSSPNKKSFKRVQKVDPWLIYIVSCGQLTNLVNQIKPAATLMNDFNIIPIF